MDQQIITIQRHIVEQERHFPEATGVFSSLLYDIALAAKIIAREARRAGLVEILGSAGEMNVQGEEQMKLDVFSDEVIIRMNSFTGRLAAMASEERENIIHIPDGYETGRYLLVFDPLDGSSNIDINATIGTIFAIYQRASGTGPGSVQDFLQKGRDLAAAGYIIYGSSTMMVYTTGRGVHGFTLDPSLGEFLLSHPDLRIPNEPKYYSTNHAYDKYRDKATRRFTRWLQGMDEDDERKPLSERYIGALVADFHRNLLKGGVFYYPADSRHPDGKLRLVYEANPLAHIAEQAGGYASDGHRNVLDIKPEGLHQRTPLFVGSRQLVEKAEEFIAKYPA
ncbi:MAG: class 1 fructose-bisphosphatase [Anaerolineae bacterium]|jgi:fructose-1,6-bisphosphatase I